MLTEQTEARAASAAEPALEDQGQLCCSCLGMVCRWAEQPIANDAERAQRPLRAWVPFHLDFEDNRLHWAPLTKIQLEKADFLDSRLLQSARPDIVKRTSLDCQVEKADSEIIWLFHFGHCGSTSLSRALGKSLSIPAYREPGAMWAFFSRFEMAQTLTPSDVKLAKALISTMTRDSGSALVKPSSLHTEFASSHLVDPATSNALFLVQHWRTCLLNGLKNIERGDELGGDYPVYEQVAWRFWKRHDVDARAVADLKQALPAPVGTLLIGWLGKISAFYRAWQELHQVNAKLVCSFEQYLAAPSQTVQRIANRLERRASDFPEFDIGDLGKGQHYFNARSFAQRLSQIESTHKSSLLKCDALMNELLEDSGELGDALRFYYDAVGV